MSPHGTIFHIDVNSYPFRFHKSPLLTKKEEVCPAEAVLSSHKTVAIEFSIVAVSVAR